MRKFYTRIFISVFIISISLIAHSQVSNYAFTTATGTFTPITGGTAVATTTSAANFLGDGRTSVSIPIGFAFSFDNVDYTSVIAGSDGFISFNPSATNTLTNNLSTTTATRRPLLAPLWDDLDGGSGTGAANYITTGTAGSRVFTIEWINWQWNYNASGATISFQVKLYEGTNVIEFIYREEAGSVNSASASIGIAGATTGSYLSLNDASSSPTASSTVNTTNISSKPATGQIYRFTPPAIPPIDLKFEAISGLPTGACPVGNITISGTIQNLGTNTIDFATNNAVLTVDITGPSAQTLNVTLNNGTLAPGASMTVPLFPNADFTAGGVYTLNGTVAVTGDGNNTNDAPPSVSTDLAFQATTPVVNDFTGFTGSNLATVFPGWKEGTGGSTPTGTTSAWISQTGLGGGANRTAKVNLYTTTRDEWIISPRFLVTANTALQYDVAVTDYASVVDPNVMGSDDSVSVMISTDCGVTWTRLRVYTAADNLTTTLTTQTVDLSAYAGQDIMIAFKATDGPVNDDPDYDFHIDDIMIADKCSGAPPVTTAVASAGTLCLGNSTSLSLTGVPSSIIGVNFQWQSSPDGTNWTNIAGANFESLIVTPHTTTHYRAVLTCTNGGASTNSTAAEITITSNATFASLPYTQDFETWVDACNITDRPSENWALFPSTGNRSWRRDDQGSSAGWTSIANGIYSPAFSTTAHSARFHSYYAPEDSTGTMDLYIDLSTDANAKLLKFDYINTSGSDKLRIYLSEDGGQTFVQVGTELGTQSSWSAKQFVINSVSATAVIRLEATSDFGATDIGVDNLNVLVGCTGMPTAGTINAGAGLPLCTGASVVLNLTGQSSTAGITYQWQSSTDNTTWTDIASATSAAYTASPVSMTYYKVIVTCSNTNDVVETPSFQVNVNNPQILSSTPATRCGVGTTTLQAAADPGATIRWYSDATGGSLLGSGNSFVTPSISGTTTYYAAAELGISPLGEGVQNSTSYESPFYHFYGGKKSQYLILASELTARGLTAGNISNIGFNVVTAGTSYNDFSISMKNTSAVAMTTTLESGLTTVYSAASVTPSVGLNMYTFLAPFAWDGTSNVILEVCWSNDNTGGPNATVKADPTGFVSHAYYRADNETTAEICGETSATNTSSIRPQIFFDGAYCQGARTAVVATVTTPPAITVLPASVTICNGGTATLGVNSANAGYAYTWMPGGMTGAIINVSPTTTTDYIVTATDNSGGASNGCSIIDTITVTVNYAPVPVTVTPAAPMVCADNVIELNTNAGALTGDITLTGTAPATSTGSSSPFYRLYEGSRRQYLIRASELTTLGLIGGSSLNSVSLNVTTLNGSPNNLEGFSIKMGNTAANVMSGFLTDATTTVYSVSTLSPVAGANLLNFSTPFLWDGSSNVFVEICFDNDIDASCTGGVPTCWGNTPSVMLAGSGFTSTVYYNADNTTGPRTICSSTSTSGTSSLRPVMIFGFTKPTTTWSPVSNLFTDAAATIPYVAGTHASSVFAKPSTATTYTITTTTIQNCSSSTTTTINMKPAPAIVTQPAASTTTCVGGSVTLSVGASGEGLTYQWRKNGVDIANATASNFTIHNVAYTDAGTYSVMVSGTCSPSVTSANSVLVVSDNNWVGTSNSDWTNPLNWCGGVPTVATSVVIPSGTPFSPIIQGNAPVNNIIINLGATVEITSSGRLLLNGNLTNDGTLNSAAGTIEFTGSANQTVSAINAANIIMNGAGGISLSGDMNIGTALTLTNGNITLGNNHLVMSGGSVGNAGSHIVTNGTGRVTNNGVGAVSVVFPVAPTATSYNPVVIANGQGRNYSVGVVTGLPAAPALANSARAINRTWNITANAAPSAAVNISLQYADAEANASASPTANMQVGVSNATNWLIATPASGHIPTGTPSGRIIHYQTVSLGETIVSNIGGINFPTAIQNIDADVTSVVLMPNVVDNMTLLRINTLRTTKVSWTVIDANGRTVMAFNKQVFAGQNDIQLALGSLASGSYQLVGSTSKGKIQTVRFIRQ